MRTLTQAKDSIISSIVERLKNNGIKDVDTYLNDPEAIPEMVETEIYNHEHDMGILEGLNRSQDLSPKDVSVAKLSESMAAGIAHFSFMKVDNSERIAFGTTNPALIPAKGVEKFPEMRDLLKDMHTHFEQAANIPAAEAKAVTMTFYERMDKLVNNYAPHRAERAKSADVVVYYDLEKREWRSFKVSMLLKIF